MKLLRFTWAFILGFSSFYTYAQKIKRSDKHTYEQLKAHVQFLADDQLEGRRAGSKGESVASDYISRQFATLGAQPKGTEGWLQPFEINDGKQINPTSYLIINSHELKLNTDFFPLNISANKSVSAMVSMALAENNVPWFLDLKDILTENKENPHFDLPEAVRIHAAKVASKGASALILYNTSEIVDGLKFSAKDKTEPCTIPVLYVNASARQQFLKDAEANLDMQLKVDIGDKKRTGHNVIGYIDNGAPHTIILGAHFDHLGYGEDGNSMMRTGEKLIHNGADDNASGTAAMIEIGRLVKKDKHPYSNFLLIAFSAEELGLNGSKYFTDHPTIDLSTVNYMINMDMVGRLNDSTKVLTVGGFGTSPTWSQVFGKIKPNKQLLLKYDSSGTGPSDHTSFYRKDIPVLFLFTGLHGDYHRPSDDADKINYYGQLQIVKLIQQVIQSTCCNGKLSFQKTRETQTTTSARFTVSMGIMPDYTYPGTGVHVDGVSEGRAAFKAGILKDDVIVQLGSHMTSSVEAYMQALSKFKKGDKTTVKYKRAGVLKEVEIQF